MKIISQQEYGSQFRNFSQSELKSMSSFEHIKKRVKNKQTHKKTASEDGAWCFVFGLARRGSASGFL